MSVQLSRFAFYSLCPHAYIHFLRCGISEGQQQSPACRSSRCENGFLRSKARRCVLCLGSDSVAHIYCYIWMLDSNIILWNRRLKQIRETCVGACSELTGELKVMASSSRTKVKHLVISIKPSLVEVIVLIRVLIKTVVCTLFCGAMRRLLGTELTRLSFKESSRHLEKQLKEGLLCVKEKKTMHAVKITSVSLKDYCLPLAVYLAESA
ncbi:hypothetical protein DKX38_024782 [Salix brachista]|uniref:Uncharacterized protein n=1 Tax=Salix brachista TaxID=2182728 RepID=A0A5N5JSW7_9ROSI|nr:hypothetical protein DKX38_024782 [Salix brachista]